MTLKTSFKVWLKSRFADMIFQQNFEFTFLTRPFLSMRPFLSFPFNHTKLATIQLFKKKFFHCRNKRVIGNRSSSWYPLSQTWNKITVFNLKCTNYFLKALLT